MTEVNNNCDSIDSSNCRVSSDKNYKIVKVYKDWSARTVGTVMTVVTVGTIMRFIIVMILDTLVTVVTIDIVVTVVTFMISWRKQ